VFRFTLRIQDFLKNVYRCDTWATEEYVDKFLIKIFTIPISTAMWSSRPTNSESYDNNINFCFVFVLKNTLWSRVQYHVTTQDPKYPRISKTEFVNDNSLRKICHRKAQVLKAVGKFEVKSLYSLLTFWPGRPEFINCHVVKLSTKFGNRMTIAYWVVTGQNVTAMFMWAVSRVL